MTDLRELTERHHRITKLMEHPDWQLLHDYVISQVEAKQRYLMNGNAKTVEEYRAEAGFVQGAFFVLGAADRLGAQIERQREEEAA